jgi:hypothetical protein
MWNDTEFPLAVFFTFRCYGTWLHGDERGSIDRHQNIYGTPRLPNNPNWKQSNQEQLQYAPVTLNAARRKIGHARRARNLLKAALGTNRFECSHQSRSCGN